MDAPVSGGVIGADQGTLISHGWGNSDVYNDIKFLFEIMGKNSILCVKRVQDKVQNMQQYAISINNDSCGKVLN